MEIGAHEDPLTFLNGPGEEGWIRKAPATTVTAMVFKIDEKGHGSVEDHTPFPATEPAPRRWQKSVDTGPAIPPPKAAA